MRKRLDIFCLEEHTHEPPRKHQDINQVRDDKFLAGLWHFLLKNLRPVAGRLHDSSLLLSCDL